MEDLKTWPISLLLRSFLLRLSLVALVFVACLVTFWLVFPSTHNGTSTVIPIILAAWLFRWRGMLLCVGVTAIALTLTYSLMLKTLSWSRPFQELALTGFLTGLCVGLIVSYLRYTVDMIGNARQKALYAEEQQLLALQEQQRLLLENEHQQQMHAIKDQFLANVNHELRTPLSGVYGYLQLMLINQERGEPSLQAQFLDRAIEGCEELIELLVSMLEATKVTADIPLPHQETLALAPLVREVVALCDPQLVQAYDIRIQIDDHLQVYADRQFIRQVLRNLLSNVFKYVPQSTQVIIDASLNERESLQGRASSDVCVCVHDAGPGIPAGEMPLLFEKFMRLKRDLTGTIRGAGLGLYISKQLIEAMNGQIWAESSGQVGDGTRFCFLLPSTDVVENSSPKTSSVYAHQ